MGGRAALVFALMSSLGVLYGSAQTWARILNSSQAIDWSTAGVGDIPARTTRCASLALQATVTEINSALASCPNGETVFLAAGTYLITGTVHIPSNVTLRGAGADKTILNAVGTGGGYVIGLGAGSVPFKPYRIVGGATGGSTKIESQQCIRNSGWHVFGYF